VLEPEQLRRLEADLAVVEARLAEPGYSDRTPQHRLDQERQFRNELLARVESARRELAEVVEPIPGGLPSRGVGQWAPLPLYEKSTEAEEAGVPVLDVEPAEIPDRQAVADQAYELIRGMRRRELSGLANRWKHDPELRRLLAAGLRTLGRSVSADRVDGPLRKVHSREVVLGPTPGLTNATELPDEFDGLTATQRLMLEVMGETAPPGRPFMRLSELAREVAIREPKYDLPLVEQTLISLGHPSLRRIPLVELQGFTGRFTPDAAHFTHARLTREGLELLEDRLAIPLLLINGAAGLSGSIPPHHPAETLKACLFLLEAPRTEPSGLMHCFTGPDFPDGGVLFHSGIGTLWRSGHGKLVARAKLGLELDESSRRARIVIGQFPWPLNAAAVHQALRELHAEGLLSGVTAIHDHSSATSGKVVVELEHLAFSGQVINAIRESAICQLTWNAEFRVESGVLDLADMLKAFIEHRREIAVQKLVRAVAQARVRAQNAEAIAVALGLLDPVLAVTRAADEDEQAVSGLMNFMRPEYREALTALPFPASHDYTKGFTEAQARHLVATRKLAARRPESVRQEWAGLLAAVEDANALLSDRQAILGVVRQELTDALARFDEPRRTEVVSA
jgi:DNA gyrase subunit A